MVVVTGLVEVGATEYPDVLATDDDVTTGSTSITDVDVGWVETGEIAIGAVVTG